MGPWCVFVENIRARLLLLVVALAVDHQIVLRWTQLEFVVRLGRVGHVVLITTLSLVHYQQNIKTTEMRRLIDSLAI